MAANSNNYQAWIGLYQNTSSPTFSEPSGGWEWVTGEPLIFTNWGSMAHALNPPNENYGEITNGGVWNDLQNTWTPGSNPIGLRHVLEISNTLTNINGCDSVAVLNLTINQSDTSYTNITVCDSFEWSGTTYNQSGTYYNNHSTNNNYSLSFDGNNDYIDIQGVFNPVSFSISFWINTSSSPSQVFRINFDGGKYFLLDIHTLIS